MASCVAWFEAVASGIRPLLSDLFFNQRDLCYRIDMIQGLISMPGR